VRPPTDPLAGTLGRGRERRKPRRGIFAPRLRRLIRVPRRQGYVADYADDGIRARGVPVYDQAAQRAELGRYGVRDTRRR
jgi:hypothetical protein